MRLVLLVPLLLLPVSCGEAAGSPCDRYADPGAGSAQRLADSLRRGEVGCLRSGRYTGDPYVLHLTRPQTTVRSAPGGRARLRGTVQVAADGVTLSRLSIEGTGAQNAVKVYARDFGLYDSDVTNRSRDGSCVLLGSDVEGTATRPVVARNVLRDCGSLSNGNKDHAIYASRVRGGRIAGNLIVRPAAYAIQLYPDARGVAVTGNVADGSGSLRGGIVLGGDRRRAARDNVVERNVVVNAAAGPVVASWAGPAGDGNLVRLNCADAAFASFAGARSAGNVVVSDSPFRSEERGDYRFRALSPCRLLAGATAAARDQDQ